MKNKRTFSEFLRIVYGMSFSDYESMDEYGKKAVEVDYINRYGAPIKWF